MADGGFLSRLSKRLSDLLPSADVLEQQQPEAVYEAAIQARTEQHAELKEALAGLLVLRNELSRKRDETLAERSELDVRLERSLGDEQGEESVELLQRKQDVGERLAAVDAELSQVQQDAEVGRTSLLDLQASIEQLRQEKVSALARLEAVEARLKVQEALDGSSQSADSRALDTVRGHVAQRSAEADVNTELGEAQIDAKLDVLDAQAARSTAQEELQALKEARDARRAAEQDDES